MTGKELLQFILLIMVPLAGAMGYVHGTFATKAEVSQFKKAVIRVDQLICKMAIRQKLDNAVEICTERRK
jgi:hypothetical protein